MLGNSFRRSSLYLLAVVGAFGFACGSDWVQVFVFVVVALISALCLVFLLFKSYFRSARRKSLWAAGAIATFLASSAGLIAVQASDPGCIRSTARWALNAGGYKKSVMAQPASRGGEMKHVLWDASGSVPSGFTLMYLVYDPEDSLAAAALNGESGKMPGIPCRVDRVHRLDSHWYTVLLPDGSNWSDCGHGM